MTAETTAAPRDWWVIAGMTTAATSAALASFTGLRGLAEAAGWPTRLAWLLPVTIDAYAMTSARIWLTGHTGQPAARRFARANALGAIAASIAGNAAYHAIGTRLLAVTWPVVVLVGAVPATVLGLTAHLHALRARTIPAPPRDRARDGTESGTADRPESGPDIRTQAGDRDRTESGTGDRPQSAPPEGRVPVRTRTRAPSRRRPRYRTEDELLAAARAADARYRQTHSRPITRDALRATLRISGPRATELRRRLAQPPGSNRVPQPAGPTPAPGNARSPVDRSPPEPPPAIHLTDHADSSTAHDRKEASTQP